MRDDAFNNPFDEWQEKLIIRSLKVNSRLYFSLLGED